MIRLTPNHTLFEYNKLGSSIYYKYRPGLIPIDEIDLYQHYQPKRLNRISMGIIPQLFHHIQDSLHDGRFMFINYIEHLNTHSIISQKVIERLLDTYNWNHGYDNFMIDDEDIFIDEDMYKQRLAYYVVDNVINAIGEQESDILFANHYGDFVNIIFE